MNTYEKIEHARKVLELPERATMDQIKTNFRRLIRQWHPDKGQAPLEKCNEMTRKITNAYKTILAYCAEYQYSFSKEEISKHLTEEEWWYERFGNNM